MSTKFLKLSTYMLLIRQSLDPYGMGDAWAPLIKGSDVAIKAATVVAKDRWDHWRSCGTAERQALAKRRG